MLKIPTFFLSIWTNTFSKFLLTYFVMLMPMVAITFLYSGPQALHNTRELFLCTLLSTMPNKIKPGSLFLSKTFNFSH
jgi:hypothetical protein